MFFCRVQVQAPCFIHAGGQNVPHDSGLVPSLVSNAVVHFNCMFAFLKTSKSLNCDFNVAARGRKQARSIGPNTCSV